MLTDLPFTLPALRQAYKDGVRPTEVIEEVFARLDAIDDPNIFIHMCARNDLLAQADALGDFDPDRPLWGIPFAAKDNIDVAGIPTTAGCAAYAYTPQADAFVISKLRSAGALLIGKTNLDQFATGLVGVRTPHGAPLNAVDPLIVPGGSSGGSGVVVGHGAVCFSLGTDTAGSGRVPAALNNIVGLKPSLGSLSASGVVPACRTLDTVSVFALIVDDAYTVFDVMREYDAADPYSKSLKGHALHAPEKTTKIGVPDAASIEFYGDTVQQAAFDRDVARLSDLGFSIDYVDFTPFYEVARMLYQGAWVAERYTVIQDLLEADPQSILPVTRKIIAHAESMSAADAFRGIYRLAALKRAAEPLLAQLDVMCVPTIPTFYSVADLEADPVTPNSNFGTYTNFVNLMDMCGIAVPTAPRNDGRPGSVTILAPGGQDAKAASVARLLEVACDRNLGATTFPVPEPQELSPAGNDRMEIAVCGAHMSGLPLNDQLTELGGVFVRCDNTSADYKFFALAGGPPARPGLVRSAAQDATSVTVEIWSLPKISIGHFLAGIPAPLGLGTIEMSNGSLVKGFICEASGTIGATDISHLGDWRKFLTQAA